MMLLGVFANYIGYRFRKMVEEFPFQELQSSLAYYNCNKSGYNLVAVPFYKSMDSPLQI